MTQQVSDLGGVDFDFDVPSSCPTVQPVLPNSYLPKQNLSRQLNTEVPAYSDTLGTWEKCHCNQIVAVTRGSLVTNLSIWTCQKCHCKRGVTVNSVTVSGEICTREGGTMGWQGGGRRKVKSCSVANSWPFSDFLIIP